ncbi:Universal stress protein [Sulfidibacter corallicola]|uniref:Universal stress protein n=1 Tax=Sulfidibacter corallicola TaxID=2818388 RepID=A0A8A4TFL8_SULCO|nr:universal stress protein [Sulfidibacter corallicola]QTD47994.1 universal stress protein [Sulfidibacter corallicola]
MKDIKKTLFATDFSDISATAQEHAVFLRDHLDCELEVVHVFDPDTFNMPTPYYFMPGVETWLDEHIATMKEKGDTALKDLIEKIAPCTGTFLEGKTGESICKHALETDCDMIVMGTHGHTGFNRLIMGSVAEYVVRHAHCSVLTIKPKQGDS